MTQENRLIANSATTDVQQKMKTRAPDSTALTGRKLGRGTITCRSIKWATHWENMPEPAHGETSTGTFDSVRAILSHAFPSQIKAPRNEGQEYSTIYCTHSQRSLKFIEMLALPSRYPSLACSFRSSEISSPSSFPSQQH